MQARPKVASNRVFGRDVINVSPLTPCALGLPILAENDELCPMGSAQGKRGPSRAQGLVKTTKMTKMAGTPRQMHGAGTTRVCSSLIYMSETQTKTSDVFGEF